MRHSGYEGIPRAGTAACWAGESVMLVPVMPMSLSVGPAAPTGVRHGRSATMGRGGREGAEAARQILFSWPGRWPRLLHRQLFSPCAAAGAVKRRRGAAHMHPVKHEPGTMDLSKAFPVRLLGGPAWRRTCPSCVRRALAFSPNTDRDLRHARFVRLHAALPVCNALVFSCSHVAAPIGGFIDRK